MSLRAGTAKRAGISSWVRVGAAVAARPRLWTTALRQMRRTAAPGWYRRAPFVPLPAGDYLRFRLVTQYGDEHHRPTPTDVVNYLAWCRDWDRNSAEHVLGHR